jgi:hypothetical protein
VKKCKICKIESSVETQKPTTISLACSKCGKTLSYEDAYLVNTGQKVKTWRSQKEDLLAFYCQACLPTKEQ